MGAAVFTTHLWRCKNLFPLGSAWVFLQARQGFFSFLFSGEAERGAFDRLLQVWPRDALIFCVFWKKVKDLLLNFEAQAF